MVALKKRPGGELPTRPLHFIWIADCSYSMEGNKIQGLNHAIREAIPAMKNLAADNVNIEVLVRAVKFSDGAKWHVAEATPLEDFKWQDLQVDSCNRDMGAALRLVADQLKMPPMTERGLPPVLILISDGQPTDDFESGLKELMAVPWGKKAVRIGIAIGEDADMEMLQKFIGNKELQPLQAHNAEQLVNYIRWNSIINTPILEGHTRQQLRFMLENYGRSIIENPRRCRGMLKDLAPKNTRETNLLMLALDNHIVAALMQKTHTPLSIHLDGLAQRLHNNFGTQKEFAFWAVESWALALDVIKSPLAQKIITPEPAPIPEIVKPAPVISLNKIGKFIVQDGVATDTETGLMWLRFAHGQRWENGTVVGNAEQVKWDEAMKIPDIFNQQGYSDYNDWRVPTIHELKTLIGKIKNTEGNFIDSDVFHKNGNRFWSSSFVGNESNNAWSVGFYLGYLDGGYKGNTHYIRLVRG